MNQKYFFSDLDGTFIKEDMLVLSAKALLQQKPLKFLLIFLCSWRGLSWIKAKIASNIEFERLNFSINDKVASLIKQKKEEGYICCLISGSNHNLVKEVFNKSSLFDNYFGSDANINLVGKNKLMKIKELTANFEYIGNSEQDIPVWRHANKAYICSSSKKFLERVVSLFPEATKIKPD